MTSNAKQETGRIYYHVFNRGVNKRKIFLDSPDYYRFIHDLYEFNDTAPANPNNRRIVGSQTSNNSPKENLISLHCFCLMPNHYHLLISTKTKHELTIFMRKLGTGYAKYFNQKYDRIGPLFQGKYKSSAIMNNEYLIHLSRYIHLNPLKSSQLKVASLTAYPYSSYPDYSGDTKFPDILSKSILTDYFNDPKSYKEFVLSDKIFNGFSKRDLFD